MAKVAFITDTHWGVRNDSPIFLEYFKKCYNEFFFPTLKERGIKHVIHLGDLVDRRKYVNIKTASYLRNYFLKPLDELGVEAHFIVGNHDEYYRDTPEVNFHTEFFGDRYKNFKVYYNPAEIEIDSTKIFLLPWVCKENEAISLERLKATDAPICCGHLEINGFEMDRGIVCDGGSPSANYRKFDSVFSGHFHHRSTRDNIHYIGAFAEYTFADFNDPRGISIFDTQTYQVEFIQNPHKMFHVVIYDDSKYKYTHEKIDTINFDRYRDSYVKVACMNRNQPLMFDYFLDCLYKASPADISIVEDMVSPYETSNTEINQTEDTPTIINKYIDGLTLNLDYAKMKDIMQTYYKEAVSLEQNLE